MPSISPQVLQPFIPIAEAMSRLLHPYAEVVLHDLATNQIAALFNAFSNRFVGEGSYLETDLLKQIRTSTGEDVIGPYPKTNWDGRKLKSMSTVLRTPSGNPVGLLCINVDVSEWDRLSQAIQLFVSPAQAIPQPRALFQLDWQEKLNAFVTQTLHAEGKHLKQLNKAEKKELILLLAERGVFKVEKAAPYVANMLGVSRSTIYYCLRTQQPKPST